MGGFIFAYKVRFCYCVWLFQRNSKHVFHENANPLSKSDISFWHEGKQEIVLENSSD